MRDYEEFRVTSAFWGWAMIVVLCLILIGWGLVNFALVKDAARQWDYAAVPEPPAGSIYTTSEPSGGPPERQIAPLPNAQPWPGLQQEKFKEARP